MSGKVTVLLADDHAAIRLGIRMVLEGSTEFEVAGEAGDGSTAVAMARALRPDIVLMDLRMPVMDGVEATRAIVSEQLSRVLALTTFDHDSYLFAVLSAGASGFLLKTAEPAEITTALRRVHEGGTVIAPEVAGRLVEAAVRSNTAPPPAADPVEDLTSREREVLRLLGEGLSNARIARRLGISEATVKTHVSNILGKLGVESRLQAALAARAL
ncbi:MULTISPECIES: response regulator [unclassified Pseudarthrobacter]|uniref:response regulator n=1 Tax=unclassified Pseudarthrobacter TaxID=2647000 RepID=UPI003635513F